MLVNYKANIFIFLFSYSADFPPLHHSIAELFQDFARDCWQNNAEDQTFLDDRFWAAFTRIFHQTRQNVKRDEPERAKRLGLYGAEEMMAAMEALEAQRAAEEGEVEETSPVSPLLHLSAHFVI